MNRVHLKVLLLIGSLGATVVPAQAGIQACNRSGKTVWVGIGWLQTATGTSFANGWWKVDPGACQIVYDKSLAKDGSFRYYAIVRDVGGIWSNIKSTENSGANATSPATRALCFKPTDDYYNLDNVNGHPSACERHDYYQLETDNHPDFTITLIPR